MNIVAYDGSFEGLLTAVYDVYEYKIAQPFISRDIAVAGSLFGNVHTVQTDEIKFTRVLKKLRDKLTQKAFSQFYKTFLSELKDIENVLLRYVQYVLSNKESVENNYSQPDVLTLQQTSRKVDREAHRMTAFVRFQLTKDNLYYSIIQPDYNVLPLILKHFFDRYKDQRWLIYDSLRKVGLYYDLEKVEEVSMHFETDFNNKEQMKAVYDDDEELYQSLWQQYFQSVNIKARKNMKLHIQHMPKRYWKGLVEKRVI